MYLWSLEAATERPPYATKATNSEMHNTNMYLEFPSKMEYVRPKKSICFAKISAIVAITPTNVRPTTKNIL